MKKLIIAAAIVCAAAMANAAVFNWQANNIYGANLTDKYSGLITLMAYEQGAAPSTAIEAATFTPTTAGVVQKTFDSAALTAGSWYNFYMVIVDEVKGTEYTFTSTEKAVQAQSTATPNINFGNMKAATQNKDNWVAAPEPTSALLLLLGVAGLALKRKQK